jgi:hypothetical protein
VLVSRSLSAMDLDGELIEMPRFRCFFIDDRNTVESFEPIDLGNEAEAVRRAEDMLFSRDPGHFERAPPRRIFAIVTKDARRQCLPPILTGMC